MHELSICRDFHARAAGLISSDRSRRARNPKHLARWMFLTFSRFRSRFNCIRLGQFLDLILAHGSSAKKFSEVRREPVWASRQFWELSPSFAHEITVDMECKFEIVSFLSAPIAIIFQLRPPLVVVEVNELDRILKMQINELRKIIAERRRKKEADTESEAQRRRWHFHFFDPHTIAVMSNEPTSKISQHAKLIFLLRSFCLFAARCALWPRKACQPLNINRWIGGNNMTWA